MPAATRVSRGEIPSPGFSTCCPAFPGAHSLHLSAWPWFVCTAEPPSAQRHSAHRLRTEPNAENSLIISGSVPHFKVVCFAAVLHQCCLPSTDGTASLKSACNEATIAVPENFSLCHIQHIPTLHIVTAVLCGTCRQSRQGDASPGSSSEDESSAPAESNGVAGSNSAMRPTLHGGWMRLAILCTWFMWGALHVCALT